MIKCVALIKRRAGLSHREFVDYYENHHALLALKFLEPVLHYQRRYLEPGSLDHQGETAGGAVYDCMTELWFSDRTAMMSTLGCLADPAVAEVIVADEEKFIDRASIRFFVIEEETQSNMHAETCAGDRRVRVE